MLELITTNQFRKDYKRAKKRGYNMKLLEETIDLLLNEQPLEKRYCDHGLVGNYSGFRECHRNQQNAPPFLENKIETCNDGVLCS